MRLSLSAAEREGLRLAQGYARRRELVGTIAGVLVVSIVAVLLGLS